MNPTYQKFLDMGGPTLRATAYINRIRSPAKKDYAKRYWTFMRDGGRGQEPSYNCSYMAAQAVRMQLDYWLYHAVGEKRS